MPGGPVPKKKHSRSRRGKRGAHLFLNAPTYVACPECGVKVRPHHACRACGSYNGRDVITARDEELE